MRSQHGNDDEYVIRIPRPLFSQPTFLSNLAATFDGRVQLRFLRRSDLLALHTERRGVSARTRIQRKKQERERETKMMATLAD